MRKGWNSTLNAQIRAEIEASQPVPDAERQPRPARRIRGMQPARYEDGTSHVVVLDRKGPLHSHYAL